MLVHLRSVLFSLVLCALLVFPMESAAKADNYDYDAYPPKPFFFEHLDLDIKIDPEGPLIDGIATYRLTPKLSGAENIYMNASHLEIKRIQVNGSNTSYSVSNDTLIIGLQEPAQAGETFEVAIRYASDPNFGVHTSRFSTIWTSNLPYSTSHWLPVYDHPRISFSTDMEITAPYSLTMAAPGKLVEESAVEDGQLITKWSSEQPIAANDLNFVLGKLSHMEARYGVKKLHIYSENGILTDQQSQQLLQDAYDVVKKLENRLGFEYPYGALHLVVLEDHAWETKPYGGSLGYIFSNGGNLKDQLRRVIIGQWYGSFRREEQWMDANGILLLQSWLNSQLSDSVEVPEKWGNFPQTDNYTLYETFSSSNWAKWISYQHDLENRPFQEALKKSASALLQESESVLNWNTLARFWYRSTGYKWFDQPILPGTQRPTKPDSIVYDLEVDYLELDKKIKLTFSARDSVVKELITFQLHEYYPGRTKNHELSFSGTSDSMFVNVSSGLRNAKIILPQQPDIELEVSKPFDFWLTQIREDTSSTGRAKAARALNRFSDNPDLQLALVDVMEQEADSTVKAEMLRTLANTTQGATGTHESYLDYLQNGALPVQIAAMEALTAYEEVDLVKRQVARYIISDVDPALKRTAIRTYRELAEPDAFRRTISRFLETADSMGAYLGPVLEELFNAPDTTEQADLELAYKLGDRYLKSDYPYSVRSKSLNMLVKNDTVAANWEARFELLLSDSDPRIRYHSLDAIPYLSSEKAFNMLNNRIFDEYDLRVLNKMHRYLKQYEEQKTAVKE